MSKKTGVPWRTTDAAVTVSAALSAGRCQRHSCDTAHILSFTRAAHVAAGAGGDAFGLFFSARTRKVSCLQGVLLAGTPPSS
jgi:hypothetical protein